MAESTKVSEIMTTSITTLAASATVTEAAKAMRDGDFGGVVVTDESGEICGFLTDRDIVTRAVAEDKDLGDTEIGEVCTQELAQIGPDSTVGDAIRMMAERSVRRIPVVDDGKPVGVVSLGDLAQARDPDSLLGQISAAPPTH